MSDGPHQQQQQFMLAPSEVCVDEGLAAVASANPGFVYIPEHRVVVERGWMVKDDDGGRRKVAMVCGGGSGHEPFAAGFVGEGMLSAAVAGSVFTSPPPTAVATAITAVGKDNPEGVLVLTMNYTGDRLNFGLAVERCRAAGMKVAMYVSGDDCALTQLEGTAGRRGLCGTLFIMKIVGAMFHAGASLDEGLATCRRLSDAIGTIGVATSGCTLPGSSSPLFTVAEGTMELGLGVHGETGAATVKSGSAKEVVKTLLTHLTRADSSTRLPLQEGDQVAVIVNNLGCLSQLEMCNLTKEVVAQLGERRLKVLRVYPGSLMTSLDMRGVHVAVLRLLDPAWLCHLDARTTAPAWPSPCLLEDAPAGEIHLPDLRLTARQENLESSYTLDADHARKLQSCIEAVLTEMPKHEESLNALDAGCGDGDCGSTLTHGISALSRQMASLLYTEPSKVLSVVADVAANSMGGTCGGLYSIFFTAAAAHTGLQPRVSQRRTWATGLRAGTSAIMEYGGATQGDRTMLDALVPALEALEAGDDDQDLRTLLKAMAAAADEGAKKTARMRARAGRASYVRSENVRGEDPGARAVAHLLQAMARY
ncbi:triokinase/FMN cyclase-like [Panulirus ornatus]|uniref:triokinase/FMN cyclase-like n=1 Tax=Panulirus ornatus TaxID=150431 RepID=UPI003A83D536